MKFFQRFGIFALALFFGIMTVALCTWTLLNWNRSPSSIQSDIIVRSGTNVWLVGGADTFGLSWRSADQTINLQVARSDLDVINGQWTSGDVDGWCLLLPTPVRTGALAVGWPSAWMVWRFSSDNEREWFPRPFEKADQGEEIATASSRILAGGGHITMSPTTICVAAAVILTSSAGWWILIRVVIIAIASKRKSSQVQN